MVKKIFLFFTFFFFSLFSETIWVDCNSQKEKQVGTKEYPFNKISEAIRVSKEGDEILINEGIYYENIQGKSGVKIKGIGRVIISGGRKIDGWKKSEKGIYFTHQDKFIDILFLKNKPLEIGRYPEKTWLKVERFEDKGDFFRIFSSELKKLKDIKNFEVRILNSPTNTFFTCSAINFNKEEGFFEISKQQYLNITEKDIFYLQHNKNFITSPGKWAIEKENEKYIVYFWPEKEEDLNSIETTLSDRVINIGNVKNFEIEGIEVCGGETNGIYIANCDNIKIKNCIVYNNKHIGISVNGSKNVLLEKNIVLLNGNGISIVRSKDIEVKNNEIAFNNIDGLVISWDSENVIVKGNYIHHHILYGHPDNIQTYRNVKNLKIEDNLLLCGGQSIMMQETYNLELRNNIIVGSGACSVIFGHQNTDNVKMYFNTVVLSQYSIINFTGKQYDVKGNIFVTGHPGAIYGINVNEYNGDYNIFYNCEFQNPTTIAASGKWYKASQFEEYKKITQKDINSIYGNPLFKNFPFSFHVVNPLNSDEENLQISLPDLIKIGDFVEINFDGIPRKVVEKKGNLIKISPKLEKMPFRIVLLCNWEQIEKFEYDLDLKEESPVKKVIYEGQIPGAKLNFKNMKNCDFNNDGKRDLPELPEEIKKIYEEKLRKTYFGGEVEKRWR